MVGVLPAVRGKGHTTVALHGVAEVCVAHYSVSSSGCKGMAKEKHSQARHAGYHAGYFAPSGLPTAKQRTSFLQSL